MKPHCIITGCGLYVSNENKYAHGDLHQVGDCYVFNACLSDGETFWWTPSNETPMSKIVVATDSNFYFERRGVIVFSVNSAILSGPARRHIAEGARK